MSTATVSADKSLLSGPAPKKAPDAPKLVRVAREHGVNPITQFAQVLQGRRKVNGLKLSDYYDFELYRFADRARRMEFVGVQGSRHLNGRLSPEGVRQHCDFLNDKVMLGEFLNGLGLRSTETQAVVDNRRLFGDLPVLRSLDDIRTFLTRDARFPLFAKPAVGSLSVGSARIDGVEEGGKTLRFGNGETVALDEFAQEILDDHAKRGFLFQTAVAQHPKLTEMTGAALGTIRVVTVPEEADRPRVLYVLWKIPSPRAMSDNFWQDGSMLAQIELETGRIQKCRLGTGLDTLHIETHPVTGRPIVGETMPYWTELKALAEKAHALFPNSGVLGWDIGMSEDGPVIVECNNSPFHALYQLATGEGVLNSRFTPVFDKVATRQADRLKAAKKAEKQKRKRIKRGG